MEQLNFGALMQLILSHTGTRFSEDRLKVWVCNEAVFGVYDRGNFHKSVKSNKPLTKKIYDYYEDSSCITFVAEDEETQKLYIHGLVREMVVSALQPTLAQCEDTINAVLDTMEKFSRGFPTEDTGDVNDALGCLVYIRKMVQKERLIVRNLYMTLFSLYSARIAYAGIEQQYKELSGGNGELDEINTLRMKQEQLNQLEPFIRDSKKYEKGLRDELKWYENSSDDFRALYDRATEEWLDCQKLYQDCRLELNSGAQRASHASREVLTRPGKHAGGKVRASKQRKKG